MPPLDAIIAPSILASDFARLAEECADVKECGADWLHVDVMDGHFVPNLTLGPPIVSALRKHTPLFLDVHLMVTSPAMWVQELAEAGANGVTFHIECFTADLYDKDALGPFEAPRREECAGAIDLAKEIRALGMRVGIALRPRTSVSTVAPLMEQGLVDMLLVMTVEPGFGGQRFMSSVMPKVNTARKLYPTLNIEVDGGLSPKTIDEAALAGANVIVAGSAVFGAKDRTNVISVLRSSVVKCLSA